MLDDDSKLQNKISILKEQLDKIVDADNLEKMIEKIFLKIS